MPRGDRMGPMGAGPRTGRGLGYCAGYDTPGYTRGYGNGFGQGLGYGRGRGFGRGYFGYNQPVAPTAAPVAHPENLDGLKEEAKSLSSRLKSLLDTIEQLSSKE